MKAVKKLGVLTLALVVVAGLAAPVRAQSGGKTPELPAPLQNMAAEGAQMRYLGREGGLDGWIAIQNGQEQYFYVTPDRSSFVMGLQFDNEGKIITLKQVQTLQEKGDDVLNKLTGTLDSNVNAQAKTGETRPGVAQEREFKTPAEQLFQDVQDSNWVALGKDGAPIIYTFVDPQCPHCKSFLSDLRADYLNNGQVQVRIIPVGFRDETMAQAAFLLAAPNPSEVFFKHLDGDKGALPISGTVNQQGVQRNLSVMQSWKLDVTPLSVYRARDGQVKIVQGRASNIATLIRDLEAPKTAQ